MLCVHTSTHLCISCFSLLLLLASVLRRYAAMASAAEALAASRPSRAYFGAQSRGVQHEQMSDAGWRRAVALASRLSAGNTLASSWPFVHAFEWLARTHTDRRAHLIFSQASVADVATRCAAVSKTPEVDPSLPTTTTTTTSSACELRMLLNASACAASPRCQACACRYARSSGLISLERCRVSSMTRCRTAALCVPVYAAACFACAASPSTSHVDAVLLLGFSWSSMSGDHDRGHAAFGLSLPTVVAAFAARLAAHIRTDGHSLFAAVAAAIPPPAPELRLRCSTHLASAPPPSPSSLLALPPSSRSPQLVAQLEPLYPTGRNLLSAEMGTRMRSHVSFLPYRVLPSVPGFRALTRRAHGREAAAALPARAGPSSTRARAAPRAVLVDVGPNGFFASAKHLLDMYAPFQPFDDVYLLDPDVRGLEAPPEYLRVYNITSIPSFVTAGVARDGSVWPVARPKGRAQVHRGARASHGGADTSSKQRDRPLSIDLLEWLPTIAHEDDFVALKFDVDEQPRGSTIEWGVLSALYHSPALRLIDELFIELHFEFNARTASEHVPGLGFHLGWNHSDHSMRQQFELLRELRRCGLAVHAWP